MKQYKPRQRLSIAILNRVATGFVLCYWGLGLCLNKCENEKLILRFSAYGAPHALLANFVSKLFVATYALLADSYLYFFWRKDNEINDKYFYFHRSASYHPLRRRSGTGSGNFPGRSLYPDAFKRIPHHPDRQANGCPQGQVACLDG